MKDGEGYGIVPGCLVKVLAPNPWKGWVVKVDLKQEMAWVKCVRRGGRPRPVLLERMKVTKPSDLDRARETGHSRMAQDATAKLDRARALRKKE